MHRVDRRPAVEAIVPGLADALDAERVRRARRLGPVELVVGSSAADGTR